MRKYLIKSIVLILTFVLCTSIQAEAKKKKVTLNRKEVSLELGNKTTLKIKNTKGKVKWFSDNQEVASVRKGKVKGKQLGTALITAKVGKKKCTCKVTVVVAKKDRVGDLVYKNSVFTEELWKNLVEINRVGEPVGGVVKNYEVMKSAFSFLAATKMELVETDESNSIPTSIGFMHYTLKLKNGGFMGLIFSGSYVTVYGTGEKCYRLEKDYSTQFMRLINKYAKKIEG